ncbi:MAG: guanylate kinase [Candidatus Omnitrophota bacterium]|jgi:guanylate kinase
MSAGRRKQGFIFILSGPSGSGKTTLAQLLLSQRGTFKDRLVKSVSLTTRRPRSAERPGKDYFFVGKDDFLKLLRDKKILEWTKYLEYYYGTPKEFVESCLDSGKYLLMCLDHKGAMRVKKAYPGRSVSIFLKPPSLRILEQRIRGRCSRTCEEEIKKRLMKAKRELRLCGKYDYCMVNGDLGHAIRDLKKIIRQSVTHKTGKVR